MYYGERVGDDADLFVSYKWAEMKYGTAAVEEDYIAVVDPGSCAAGDGFFGFDVDGCFVGEGKGRVGGHDFDGAAVGTLEEAVGGQLIKVPADGDAGDVEGCGQVFDRCFAGCSQLLKYRLFSFLKIHLIRLFLNKFDQK